ncbi:hypothetical protein ACFYU8_18250 [Brevibacillus sp. NPDC003359]|uniref:hypothetical protein n=1 Tax=unclassified Brevibacillus TaxID=2684853 RepID=UPI0036777BAC
MKITKEEYINTGSNCMVYSLWIEASGKVRSINIDKETVIGCSFTYDDDLEPNDTNDLWVKYYDLPLETTLGPELNDIGIPAEIVDRIMYVITNIIWKYRY